VVRRLVDDERVGTDAPADDRNVPGARDPHDDAPDDERGGERDDARDSVLGNERGDGRGDGRDAAAAPLAHFDGVTRSYHGVHALGPLDVVVDGDVVGLLGPNGAGKTTMIRLLMGAIRPTTGTVRVLGHKATDHGARRRIGYAPEGQAAFPHLTGVRAVAYAGRLVGMKPTDAMQRAHQVLDYVGLHDERYRRVATYSTGMRQRVKIAQALVHDPDLLILDEPTEGVDPQAREEILRLVEELRDVHGIRLLVSTHLLADVERLATHAIVLRDGQVVAHGPLDALRAAVTPAHFVRVDLPVADVLAKLRAAGIPAEVAASGIQVALADPTDVLRSVRDAGAVVRHLAPVRAGLDTAFEGGPHDA
jgi:ABC-2 type transport system ATP-binding protein